MTTTTNLALKKPDADDFYNVEDFNDNADIIDAAVGKMANDISGKAPKNHTHAAGEISGLAAVATSGKYSDLSGKPTALPANGGNAKTVNGHTVGKDVPANAVFTDTTYGAATETEMGLVSTAVQNFAGNKFVTAERIGLRMKGVTKGTAPTATQIAHIQFQDNSGANTESANLGQIYHQVQADTAASILTLVATDALTENSNNRTTLSIVYGNGHSYSKVSPPDSPMLACLRNLASGTAAATTDTCRSGAWYGKHA